MATPVVPSVRSLVTFDFHNTLAVCDPWFSLEIRDLPVDVLRDLAPDALDCADPEALRASYRALRQDVIASGREVDALTSVERVLAAHGVALAREQVARSIDRLMREALEHAAPVPGAVETVRAVAADGHAVGVVSSAVYHPFLEWTLDAFGLRDALAFVITSVSSGIYKSDPAIYRQAMTTAGASPERSLHVGDSLRWDVATARQAGMRTIWFANGHADVFAREGEGPLPDLTIHSMVGAAPLILERLGR